MKPSSPNQPHQDNHHHHEHFQQPPPYSPPGQNPPQPSAPTHFQPNNQTKATGAPPPPGLNIPNNPNPVTTQQPTIIYSQTTITPASFGPYPMRYTCPHCNAHIMTETHSTPGLLTIILCSALCLLAGYCLCSCLIPCCFRECKDIEHRCPNCQHKLGLFKRI